MEPRVCGFCGELPLFWEVEMGLACAVDHPAWLGRGGLGERARRGCDLTAGLFLGSGHSLSTNGDPPHHWVIPQLELKDIFQGPFLKQRGTKV